MEKPLPVRLDDLIHHVTELHPSGDPLQRLSDAVLLADRIGEQADHLIGHFVDQARRSGASWTQIGVHMGVSKQAVQKRFVTNRPDAVDPNLFARFTERAKVVLTKTHLAARTHGNDAIGSEHIVLGLLAEPEALAANVMTGLGVDLDEAKRAAEAVLPPSTGKASGVIPLSAEALDIVSTLTLREALGMGHNYIGTEHFLLGVQASRESTGARVLSELGVTHQAAKERIESMLAAWVARQQPNG
jgi:hypothetical protein